MGTVKKLNLFNMLQLTITLILLHCAIVLGFSEQPVDMLSMLERAAFTNSLKPKNIDELKIMLKDNGEQKVRGERNFIIIEELLLRSNNNEATKAIIKEFLEKDPAEIAIMPDSKYVKLEREFLKLRYEACGDTQKLALALGKWLAMNFDINRLLMLADLPTAEAQPVLNRIRTVSDNQQRAKQAAIFINQNRHLTIQEFIKLILTQTKDKIAQGEKDFGFEFWIFYFYSKIIHPQSTSISAYLKEALVAYLAENPPPSAVTTTYTKFLRTTIEEQEYSEAVKRAFAEKVANYEIKEKNKHYIAALQKEITNHTKSPRFFSALHYAINVCANNHVAESIPLLLSNISFELTADTAINQQKLTVSDCFPAAKALATLRPPTSVILQAMQAIVPLDKSANNEPENGTNAKKRLQLLTWILYQIEENDAELVKFILQREMQNGKDKNGSFVQALKLLENPDELLPQAF